MARITVEDCIDKVPNRFDLILLSAHRARVLAKGAAPTVEQDKDKPPVIALREIAERTLPSAASFTVRNRKGLSLFPSVPSGLPPPAWWRWRRSTVS